MPIGATSCYFSYLLGVGWGESGVGVVLFVSFRCGILRPCLFDSATHISGFLFAGLIVGLVLGALDVGLHANHMITQTLDAPNCNFSFLYDMFSVNKYF